MLFRLVEKYALWHTVLVTIPPLMVMNVATAQLDILVAVSLANGRRITAFM